MHQKYFQLASITALMMSSAAVLALPFNSYDPRSMAMGSAGVAVGDPSTAPFFNPALLTASDPKLKYSVEFPIIGVRLYDPGNMEKNLPILSSNISALNTSITAANTSANSADPNVIKLLPGQMTTVANDITKVNNSLSSLGNQPLQGELGAAAVIGVPGKEYGFAFYTDAWMAMGGTLEYNDATTLSNLSSSVSAAANALSATTGTGAAACTAVQNGTGTAADITNCLAAATAINNSLVTAQGAVNFSTATSIASKIHLRGVIIRETGLSVSHGFVVSDKTWSLGITPKIMQLHLFDALLAANTGNTTSGLTGGDYLAKYDNSFNFDLGAAKSYLNGWRTGVTVKNVLSRSYDFKRAPTPGATPVAIGSTLNIRPLVRTGVSHENDWSTIAFDLDLTQNDPAGLENKSQYAALGGELDALGWAQLRAGYRADLLNSERNVTSVGLGISPRIPYFKFHFDLAYAYNKKEQGASLRFGLNF